MEPTAAGRLPEEGETSVHTHSLFPPLFLSSPLATEIISLTLPTVEALAVNSVCVSLYNKLVNFDKKNLRC